MAGNSGGGGRGGGGGGSRYSSSSQSGGGEQVVPLGNDGSQARPSTLLTAVSSIQHYYVIEKGGKEIPPEFLTIEGTIDYFKIGGRSGFNEGLMLFFIYPLMEFLIIPFYLKDPSHFMVLTFKSLPFFMIIFNTLLCGYISKFYIGKITRKAINALFTGRAMSLFLKGCVIWVLYVFAYRLGKPEIIWSLAEKFGKNAEKIYYGYYHIQDKIMPTANRSFAFLAIAAIGPYGVVYLRDLARRHRIKKNQELISSKLR